MELLNGFQSNGVPLPAFLEAGPRAELRHDFQKVRAAIVTTGGLAPGLHCVIHSIVKRHTHTYPIDRAAGRVFGVYNSFKGLCSIADNLVDLDSAKTEEWLDQGGSKLGSVRYYHGGKPGDDAIEEMTKVITANLRHNNIDILYVIGGDNSLKVAHKLAAANPNRSIVGIPKTMDNDILWVWQSFGFDTAVEEATRVINTMRSEAEATRRICLIELFGAESGFVAANAALASGHADLVLIPEVFSLLETDTAQQYLSEVVMHIERTVQSEPHNPHAVVVVAEGVGTMLEKKQVCIGEKPVTKATFVKLFTEMIEGSVHDAHGQKVRVAPSQPQHLIRAVPANAHDQIYCERLGALAVDNALAGYTDFMVSQWLTEYTLVPLRLVSEGQKSIPVNGIFWKQVVNSTGQPLSPAERLDRSA
ncbi:MAG: 6-phosphofructokinase [Acidobacteria bacterium]|nr:6-phosphofructokinase [Acidobacteriota bacterium]